MSDLTLPLLPGTEGMRHDIIVPQVIKQALSELLNSKHLYQSVHIKWIEVEPQIAENHLIGNKWRREGRELLCTRFWRFADDKANLPGLPIELPLVSTFCQSCKKQQPHNPHKDDGPHSVCSGPAQVLCIRLECQGCKKSSVVFLVTRHVTKEGVKLQLTGRSILEQVEVPTYIPKEHEKFYSSAVVAFNSGQILPALFMLRTLIEQHMRRQTGKQEPRGEDLCNEYAELLDTDFKKKAPSFKDIYAQLSDALHRAAEDPKLFESERNKIELHFQGKQAFDAMDDLQKKNAEKQVKKISV